MSLEASNTHLKTECGAFGIGFLKSVDLWIYFWKTCYPLVAIYQNENKLGTIQGFTCFQTVENYKHVIFQRGEICRSIGSLVRLVFSNLCNCVNLRSLPVGTCNLWRLKILNIGGCGSVEALPIKLGSIKSLKVPNGEKLSVSVLPDPH